MAHQGDEKERGRDVEGRRVVAGQVEGPAWEWGTEEGGEASYAGQHTLKFYGIGIFGIIWNHWTLF